jgi:hypothetical protein
MCLSDELETYQRMYPDAPVVNWSDIYRGGMFHAVKPEMLEGTVKSYTCRVKGDNQSTPQQLRLVIFDRDYVIAKLARDTKAIANELSQLEWLSLMSEIYNHHDEQV